MCLYSWLTFIGHFLRFFFLNQHFLQFWIASARGGRRERYNVAGYKYGCVSFAGIDFVVVAATEKARKFL
jgi:hypothetical protein